MLVGKSLLCWARTQPSRTCCVALSRGEPSFARRHQTTSNVSLSWFCYPRGVDRRAPPRYQLASPQSIFQPSPRPKMPDHAAMQPPTLLNPVGTNVNILASIMLVLMSTYRCRDERLGSLPIQNTWKVVRIDTRRVARLDFMVRHDHYRCVGMLSLISLRSVRRREAMSEWIVY